MMKTPFADDISDVSTMFKGRTASSLVQHIDFNKGNMKVSLAAQTLSKSVTDAIGFLQKFEEPGFEEAHRTITFIRSLDRPFDLLNSGSPYEEGHQQGFCHRWTTIWDSLLEETCEYFKGLKDQTGKRAANSKEKIHPRLHHLCSGRKGNCQKHFYLEGSPIYAFVDI